ncbi:MAG: hypothetical protein ACREOC_16285 [Gemmatimonadales bacterium]
MRRLGVLPSEPLTTALATLRKMFAMSCHHGVGMIAFEISIDGQRKCTAGVPDVGVASVIANWVRRASRDPTSGQPIPGRFEEELTLDVGGLSHDPDGGSVHLKWLQQPLKLGQRITLAIVETEEADPPRARDREDPAWAERRKREYYERLKREYGDA